MRKVTLIPGDGTGPELIAAALRVIEATGAALEWEVSEAGAPAFARCGDPLPPETRESMHRTGLILKGPMAVPLDGYGSPNTTIRKEFGIDTQVRLAYHFSGSKVGYPGTAITIVRQYAEGLGRGPQEWLGKDAGFAMKVITRGETERIARFAFEYARAHGLRKVLLVLQATTHRTTDGLFHKVAMEVAEGYPDLEVTVEAPDAACLYLVKRPQDYQVLLTESFCGGFLAGLCSGLIGSVGLMPGGNYGSRGTVFEAGHGNAPKYAGLDKVNPTGVILSGAMMLDHIGEKAASDRVWKAVRSVIEEGRWVTYDLGGTAGTSEMADAIVDRLNA